MSKLETNIIAPSTGTTLTLGESGDSIVVPSGVTITNNGTQTGFGGTNTPAFLAYNSVGDTVANESYVKVDLDTEVYDTDSAFNTTTYRFTVPTGKAGYYNIYGSVNGRNTDNRLRSLDNIFYKNGSRINSGYDYVAFNNADSGDGHFRGFTAFHSLVIYLAEGDYVEMYAYFTVSFGSPIIDQGATYFGGYKLLT